MESPREYSELPDPRIDAERFRIELIRNMFRLLADVPPAARRKNRNDRDERTSDERTSDERTSDERTGCGRNRSDSTNPADKNG
jgi:hypothetical protein